MSEEVWSSLPEQPQRRIHVRACQAIPLHNHQKRPRRSAKGVLFPESGGVVDEGGEGVRCRIGMKESAKQIRYRRTPFRSPPFLDTSKTRHTDSDDRFTAFRGVSLRNHAEFTDITSDCPQHRARPCVGFVWFDRRHGGREASDASLFVRGRSQGVWSMTQTPILSAVPEQPQPSARPSAVARPPRDANPLHAWGLDSSFPPYSTEPLETRSEVKPLGVVCEPVN